MKHLLEEFLSKAEEKLIFHPMRKAFNEPIETIKNKIEDVYFKSGNDTLNGWYLAPKGHRAVVLYCHGQGENISTMQEAYAFMEQRGIGFFAIDYSGHGKSSGKPHEKKIYANIEASIEYLKNEKNITKENIIIWGRSMGGAIAAEAATRHKFLATIIESSFTNLKDAALSIARKQGETFSLFRKIIFTFASLLPLSQNFDTYSKIKNIKSPLLIIHSKQDELIDYKQALLNSKKAPKHKLVIIDEGCHEHSEWAFKEIADFIDLLSPVEA